MGQVEREMRNRPSMLPADEGYRVQIHRPATCLPVAEP